MKLSSNERRNHILQEVVTHNEVSINDLATKFAVTTETIRKDVGFLQDKHLLAKKHGSVTVADPFIENEFTTKEQALVTEKNKIAEMAMTLIPERATIFLDASTTVMQLAKLLMMRNNLTIVTNSLQINQALANSDHHILLTGGAYRKKSSSYTGNWTINAVKQLNLDYAFLGCAGLASEGPTIHAYEELEIKKTIIAHSQKNILLCDSTKLLAQGPYTFCNYSDLDMIVMERGLTPTEKKQFPEDTFFFQTK